MSTHLKKLKEQTLYLLKETLASARALTAKGRTPSENLMEFNTDTTVNA